MVWYRLFAVDIIVSRLATQPLHGVGQLGVTSVKLKSHHLLRDWPILKVCEKKFSSLQKQLFKNVLSLTLDFPVSPLAIDKTATKNQAKIQLKHVLTGDRESGFMSTRKKERKKRINACTGLKVILKHAQHADKVIVRRSKNDTRFFPITDGRS